MISKQSLFYIVIMLFGFNIGCGTVGADFNEKRVAQIQTGSSKKEDIQKLFDGDQIFFLMDFRIDFEVNLNAKLRFHLVH